MLQLALECKPVDVALSHSGTRIAVLSDVDVAVYSIDLKRRPITRPSLIWKSRVEGDVPGHAPRHVTFADDDKLFILTDMWDEEESFICMGETNDTCDGGSVTKPIPILEPGKVSSIVSDVEGRHVVVAFHNGSLNLMHREDGGNVSLDSSAFVQFPSFAPEVKIAKIEEQACSYTRSGDKVNKLQFIAFGLTKSGVLYGNERVLVRNCASFAVTPAHLIFTTTQNLLKFVHLTCLAGKMCIHRCVIAL